MWGNPDLTQLPYKQRAETSKRRWPQTDSLYKEERSGRTWRRWTLRLEQHKLDSPDQGEMHMFVFIICSFTSNTLLDSNKPPIWLCYRCHVIFHIDWLGWSLCLTSFNDIWHPLFSASALVFCDESAFKLLFKLEGKICNVADSLFFFL